MVEGGWRAHPFILEAYRQLLPIAKLFKLWRLEGVGVALCFTQGNSACICKETRLG